MFWISSGLRAGDLDPDYAWRFPWSKQLGKLPVTTIQDGVFHIRPYLMKRIPDTKYSGKGTYLATLSSTQNVVENIFWCRSWQIVHRRKLLWSRPRLFASPPRRAVVKEGWRKVFCLFFYLKKDFNWQPQCLPVLLPIVCFTGEWLPTIPSNLGSHYSVI